VLAEIIKISNLSNFRASPKMQLLIIVIIIVLYSQKIIL